MKRSLLAFATLCLAAIAFCWRIAEDVTCQTVAAYHRIKAVTCDFAAAAVKSVAERYAAISQIRVPLEQARAFVTRLAKRERPVVTSSWRMCPST